MKANINKTKEGRLKSGFTLVELIVAVGIFVTAVTIALGSLIGLYSANNKSQSLASVINNVNYTIESMVRDIRFATTYHCGSSGIQTEPQNCEISEGGGTYLALDTPTAFVVYQYVGNKIQKSVNGGPFVDVTSSEVTIQRAKFYVYHTEPGDESQPHVILVLRGHAGKKPSEQSTFDIQTTISQRALNF